LLDVSAHPIGDVRHGGTIRAYLNAHLISTAITFRLFAAEKLNRVERLMNVSGKLI
jgi:hypothetical protein